jgi:hypothetical protein
MVSINKKTNKQIFKKQNYEQQKNSKFLTYENEIFVFLF